MNIYIKNHFAYAGIGDISGIRYPTDIKSAGFRSQLEGNQLGVVKEFKFDQTNKWYMHNLESVLENETDKLRLDLRY